MNTAVIENWLVGKAAAVLNVPKERVERTVPLTSQGLDSLAVLTLTGDLAEWLDRDLPAMLIWEHPTIEGVAKQIVASDGADLAAVPRAPRDRPLPVSPSQERVIRHSQWDGGDLNVFMSPFLIRGPLDVKALRRALRAVIDRHEILRTTFLRTRDEVFQIVHPDPIADLVIVDLRKHADPLQEMGRLAEIEPGRPMHLGCGPLIRATLLLLGRDEFGFFLALHHLLYDASSLPVFYDELGAFYRAFREGRRPPAMEPPFQAAELAAWQRDRLRKDGPHYQRLLAWWTDYLKDSAGRPLELPFRMATPPAPPTNEPHDVRTDHFPAALRDSLQRLAKREDTTRFAVLLAAFETLLFQVTGQDAFVVGAYVSDRSRLGARAAMGFFVNLVALAANLSGAPTFAEVVRRARDTLSLVSIHQELPFDDLEPALVGDGRQAPAVRLIFQQVRVYAHRFRLAGADVSLLESRARTRPWELSVAVVEMDDDIYLRATFDPKVYRRSNILALTDRYLALTEELLANPDRPVCPRGGSIDALPRPRDIV
jgi:acyl carrier protein